MKSILLIDDNPDLLHQLQVALEATFHGLGIGIRTWVPSAADEDPVSIFEHLIDDQTILVVTDYDLTSKGKIGLFGTSIVSWCQSKAIPVGDFSRGNHSYLPKEPNLFEIRVPPTLSAAANYVTGITNGFLDIGLAIERSSGKYSMLASPAAVLGELLGRPTEIDQFILYGSRVGASNPFLMEYISSLGTGKATDIGKNRLISYLTGHLLLNSILKFPGPILSSKALAAYMATDPSECETFNEIFKDAAYLGPFSGLDNFFWRSQVDEILDNYVGELAKDLDCESQGEVYRLAIEQHLGRKLKLHSCPRCEGRNGGFLCPFTGRTVCQRTDCSVGSSLWIPPGARISRMEKDFYDEWAPILGY